MCPGISLQDPPSLFAVRSKPESLEEFRKDLVSAAEVSLFGRARKRTTRSRKIAD